MVMWLRTILAHEADECILHMVVGSTVADAVSAVKSAAVLISQCTARLAQVQNKQSTQVHHCLFAVEQHRGSGCNSYFELAY